MTKKVSKKSQVLEQILRELIEKKSKDLSFDYDEQIKLLEPPVQYLGKKPPNNPKTIL